MKPISIGAKLLPVTTLQWKQYGVVLRNDSTRRVYHNFGAFPSAGLNHCFGNKRNKIFSLFWKKIWVNLACQNIPAKEVWQVANLKSILAQLWQFGLRRCIFTNLNAIILWQNINRRRMVWTKGKERVCSIRVSQTSGKYRIVGVVRVHIKFVLCHKLYV